MSGETEIRVNDTVRLSWQRDIPKYLGFLSPSEHLAALKCLSGVKHGFFGGYDSCERTVLGVFPDWYSENKNDYPVTAVNFSYNKAYKLLHKDFLGSIMALGVTRKSVGDILVGDGVAVAFVLEDIAQYVAAQLSKVGSVGVKTEIGIPEQLPQQGELKEFSSTVSSLRLDCIISALISKSRKESAALIEKDMVLVNSVPVKKLTHCVRDSDEISVRKYGKYIIEGVAGTSKKGRIILNWKKYV